MCAAGKANPIKVNNPATIHGANWLIVKEKIFGLLKQIGEFSREWRLDKNIARFCSYTFDRIYRNFSSGFRSML